MMLLVIISLLAGPVWSNLDEQLETVLAVTECRASCIDQFSHTTRDEANCLNETYCFMCWEMCNMVMERFEVWGSMCFVPEVCTPGCQLACDFIQVERNDSDSAQTLMLNSHYSKHNDRVNVIWDQDLESTSTVLYSVLLKDKNKQWNLISQTTSHAVHINRGLINKHTEIRVLAANASTLVFDSKNTFLGNHVTESAPEIIMQYTKNLWKPHLESLTKSDTGLQATVVWPIKQDENGPMQYEVSWSVIDETIEVTGHLHTTNNAAVLTLWPDSLYSVQVNCYGADRTLRCQSEPLVIDTKNSHINKQIERINQPVCSPVGRIVSNAFAILSAIFIACFILALYWIVKLKRSQANYKIKEISNDSALYHVDPVRGNITLIPEVKVMIPSENKL